ncbi:DUF4080 domain-containing protein, partial [uncultured Clostridium sp.]|uniref:DUF4080 domain-containing protein n=1 Tax=uncultured Clostridium sp. TaxID=59620 RepID=UPI00261FA393
FYEKGYLGIKISSVDYYKIFIEFNEEKLKADNFVLKEIVKFDYLQYNKKKWIPDFLTRDMDKVAEREIREKLVKSNVIDDVFGKEFLSSKKNLSNIHVEKYMIDILEYVDNNTVCIENHYLAYDINDEEHIKDITSIVV